MPPMRTNLPLQRAFFGAQFRRHLEINQRLLHAAVDDVGERGEYDRHRQLKIFYPLSWLFTTSEDLNRLSSASA